MKFSRAGGPKSRTGCHTCKKQRVKCDETKPLCKRCIASNRPCAGFGILVDPPNRPPLDNVRVASDQINGRLILPKPTIGLPTVPSLAGIEPVLFDHFRSQTIFQMAGVRTYGFWHNVVLPACYQEPAILHAAMALANTDETYHHARNTSFRPTTLAEYNKAINHLNSLIRQGVSPSSLKVALIVCIVFITIEIQTGRLHKALLHLNEGRKLLHTSIQARIPHTESGDDNQATPYAIPSKPQTIEEELVGIFADLDLQWSHFSAKRPQIMLTEHMNSLPGADPWAKNAPALPPNFTSLHQAHQFLLILTNKSIAFVNQRFDPSPHSTSSRSLDPYKTQVRDLCERLGTWKNTFTRFQRAMVSSDEISQNSFKQHSALLLLQYSWLSILVPTVSINIDEMAYNSYIEYFEDIVRNTEVFLPDKDEKKSSAGYNSRRFSLEFGVVAPLWFTAMKCRHPWIRRRALELLERSGREGLWDSGLVGTFAGEAIRIEEGADGVGESCLGSNGEDWRRVVARRRRIGTATVAFEDDDEDMLVMTFRMGKPGRGDGYESEVPIVRRVLYSAR